MSMPITDNELSEILVMEILLRLPVKSLMRFKCVCKSWYSSFQTSYFITNHRNNLNLFFKGFDKVPYLSLLSTETEIKKHDEQDVRFNLKVKEKIHMPVSICNSWRLTVSGPCNGLLCLHDGYTITLWNPSTREVKLLPESPTPSTDYTYFFCIGFGFDRKFDDYKILVKVIHCVWSKSTSQIYLYSLNTNSWRELPHPNVFIDPFLFNTYINGIYYWKVTSDDDSYLILSFDMAEEVFSTLPLLNFGMSNARCLWCIAPFNEALATIVHPTEGMEKCYDIWVLNGYSWTKQLTIGPILGVERPLALWKNGELFLLSENNTLVMFDPCTGELHDFGIHMSKYTMRLVVYAESIIPIKGISEYDAKLTRQVLL
ncbi:PREDICTED: F-box/kelch-repeat protein At3g23880-like [Theobroma cacao]|uniref:F-box/kelch-repeat protein At3g23880-like n=1 Tax=Theobroma cacao TaxID=3641 RepID=A0AB32X2P9_THECC|nr:PREDICTED: F-box/kelch-repeat protein At3g23880-like [Theobroma cacao]